MSDESNIVQVKLRPFHQRLINAYRLYRVFGLPRAAALHGAWVMARVTRPAPLTIGKHVDEALTDSILPSVMRSLQATIAAHYPVPRSMMVDPESAEAMGFDAWMAVRTGRAHRQFMARTSQHLLHERTPEQIEQYLGASHGGID